ncbi:NAD(P)-dependent oxidoreductase [Streptomyces sp. Wb2n-11]|uniref:NAD(P)-dependent oxidoreductase n=1 Tax=Streptomyces sp. Wb2n-11 TaxID=1030533 RepID=UPI0021004B22|nr:NAD(P)-binding domain-containing protein [Streptomyces sp. Wb2n-11]
MTSDHPAPVTVIGLGSMGRALAGAFLDAGRPTTVWNRSEGKGDDLVARGAVLAATAEEAVRASGLTVVCVVDYDASQAILEPLADALAGRVLVNLTSDSPERARTAAAWAGERGIAYLDGAVMVPTQLVGGPEALILYAGERPVFEKYQSVLEELAGRSAYLGGDHGLAAVYDLSMLDLFYASMSGLVHAFALAREDKVAATALAPYLNSITAILPDIAAGMAAAIDAGNYDGEQANLSMMTASVDHLLHMSRDRGLDTGQLEAIKAVADRAVAEGHGADDWVSTIEVLKLKG